MEGSEERCSQGSGRCRLGHRIQTVALIALAGLWALACTISPVVSVPESPRYIDCERAARRYCEEVHGSDDDLDRCIAEQTLRCVSGRHD